MATQSQIIANRKNSKHSTGPNTSEGKSASSANAITHGLGAADPVLPTEDRDQFNQLLEQYKSQLAPSNIHQEYLVSQMAGARWKLDRLERIEGEMFQSLADLSGAFTDDETAKKFARLERYRATLERTYHRCARELRAAQKDAKQNEAKYRQIADDALCNYITAVNEAPLPAAILEAQAEINRKWAAQHGRK